MDNRENWFKYQDSQLVGILKIKGVICGSNKGKYKYYFYPYQSGIGSLIVSTSINRVSSNGDILAVVKCLDWPSGQSHPNGQLMQKLGTTDNPDEIVLSWIHHYQLTAYLKVHPVVQVKSCSEKLIHEQFENQVCSIDPPGCVDIDDCFHMDDNYIYIHISLLGHMFLQITEKIVGRFSSLYLPNKTYHMLPTEIVSAYSLTPNQTRQVMTLQIKRHSEDLRPHFYISQIINAKQYTYDQIDANLSRESQLQHLQHGQNSHNCQNWQNILSTCQNLYQTMLFSFDHKNDAHFIVDTLMLTYNLLATRYLIQRGYDPIIRSARETGSPENAKTSLLMSVSSEIAASTPIKLSYQYSYYQEADSDGHARHPGLNVEAYGQFSSPIRRLIDIHNQYLLLKTVTGEVVHPRPARYINFPPIEKINQDQNNVKKFHRKCLFYQIDKKLAGKVVSDWIVPIEKINDQEYYCCWSAFNVISKLKLGINQETKIQIGKSIMAKIAVIHCPLPKLKYELGGERHGCASPFPPKAPLTPARFAAGVLVKYVFKIIPFVYMTSKPKPCVDRNRSSPNCRVPGVGYKPRSDPACRNAPECSRSDSDSEGGNAFWYGGGKGSRFGVNPETGRKIKVGGKTWKKLLNRGYLETELA